MTPEQLAARLSDAAKDLERPEKLTSAIGRVVRPHIVRHAPVRTGELRRRVYTRTENQGKRLMMGSSAPYAGFVHARVPFVNMGTADAKAEIEAAMGEYGQELWQKVARGG
jgi:hypothetical protein